MERNSRFDIIIAGAGAAGLTLIWYILQSSILRNKRILILDKSINPLNDKTWCYWESENLDLSDFIHHSWNELEVGANGNMFSEVLSEYHYNCIRNGDYASVIIKKAKELPNITFLETSINSFNSSNNFGVVETEAGTFEAPIVFQSVKPSPGFKNSKVDVSLIQHFIGWEIETNGAVFNPNKAVFMDFNVPQKNGVTFMYVLPTANNTALVEYTIFSDELLNENEYEAEIEDYLKSRYQLNQGDYNVVRKEKGAIPMEDRKFDTWYCDNIMNVGTVGGLTKPTTGYTFIRIHNQSREIVSALEQNKKPSVTKSSSYRFRVYDMMLLNILNTDHAISLKIFHNLFKKNRFDSILRFLEEKTNIFQELSIFSTLPYTPFFKSIYKMKHRIFTGA
ncbi:MAG: hypothetical protein EA391_06970 [Balneolaceae bacterium]|nr:MAG: hypothetical protein EA391_06970 [Balneolaceae bacterium]